MIYFTSFVNNNISLVAENQLFSYDFTQCFFVLQECFIFWEERYFLMMMNKTLLHFEDV